MDFLDHCFFSDEAWFNLNGNVNSQNCRFWSANNPHLIHDIPLHQEKIGVWAAMTKRRVFFTFLNNIVNSDVYKTFIDQLIPTLNEEEIMRGWFQQDGATAHTSTSSMNHVRMFFGERIISKGLWPPRSPDLSPPDFFLWGHLKERVYRNSPQNIEQLQANITAEMHLFTPAMLQAVSASVLARAHSCLLVNGAHFQNMPRV